MKQIKEMSLTRRHEDNNATNNLSQEGLISTEGERRLELGRARRREQ